MALNQAGYNGRIARNPALNVKLPKIRPKEMRVLSIEEQRKLEKTALAAFEDGKPKGTQIVIGDTKTFSSRRSVPITADMADKMAGFKAKQDEAIENAGEGYRNEDYLLASDLGKHYEPRHYEELFYSLVEQAGLEKANFHSLRHTFATRCIEAGMDVYVVSKLLGHTTPTPTLNRYGHLLPDHRAASIEKLESYMNKQKKSPKKKPPPEPER